MRQDKLIISTMSKFGRYSAKKIGGMAYLTVTKGFNEPSNQIAIEVDHTTGTGPFLGKQSRETALINITFADGSIWSGNFDSLKKALVPGKSDLTIEEHKVIVEEIDKWFDGLEILKRMEMSEAFNYETGDNTDLTNGLTKEGREWLAKEYHTTILNALRSEL